MLGWGRAAFLPAVGSVRTDTTRGAPSLGCGELEFGLRI